MLQCNSITQFLTVSSSKVFKQTWFFAFKVRTDLIYTWFGRKDEFQNPNIWLQLTFTFLHLKSLWFNTLISVLACWKNFTDVISMLQRCRWYVNFMWILKAALVNMSSVKMSLESSPSCRFISRLPVMRPAAFWVNLEVSLWLEKAMCQISHICSDIPTRNSFSHSHTNIALIDTRTRTHKHVQNLSSLLYMHARCQRIKLVYYFQREKNYATKSKSFLH